MKSVLIILTFIALAGCSSMQRGSSSGSMDPESSSSSGGYSVGSSANANAADLPRWTDDPESPHLP